MQKQKANKQRGQYSHKDSLIRERIPAVNSTTVMTAAKMVLVMYK